MILPGIPSSSGVFWNCDSKSLTLRYSLLDIKVTPYRVAAQPATVVRVQIQPRDFASRRQHDAQLQLCVPQVGVKAFSYRRVRTTSGTAPTWRTCCGWAGCPRRGFAPPQVRELRELTRYRIKLVRQRTSCKDQPQRLQHPRNPPGPAPVTSFQTDSVISRAVSGREADLRTWIAAS